MTPFLTDMELRELTHPLRQAKARRRYLDRLGVVYTLRPDGQPIVGREVIASRLGAVSGTAKHEAGKPNEAALLAMFGNKRRP